MTELFIFLVVPGEISFQKHWLLFHKAISDVLSKEPYEPHQVMQEIYVGGG